MLYSVAQCAPLRFFIAVCMIVSRITGCFIEWFWDISGKLLAGILTVSLLWLLPPAPVYAAGAFDIFKFKAGRVLGRGLVLDEQGRAQYVEYNDDGTVAAGWSHPLSKSDNVFVVSAAELQIQLDALKKLKSNEPNIRIMSRAEYEALTLQTVTKQPMVKPALTPDQQFVVLKAQNNIKNTQESPLLMTSNVDLRSLASLASDTKTVLVDSHGKILRQSNKLIALKSAFLASQNLSDPKQAAQPLPTLEAYRSKAYAPFKEAEVNTSAAFGFGDVTDADGDFVVQYFTIPCPCFTYNYDTSLTATYKYSAFESNGRTIKSEYIMMPSSETCIGYDACFVGPTLTAQMTRVSVISIIATISELFSPVLFFVDVGFISGLAVMQNPDTSDDGKIGIGTTEYSYSPPKITNTPHPDPAVKIIPGFVNDGDFICAITPVDSDVNNEMLPDYEAVVYPDDPFECDTLDSQPKIVRVKARTQSVEHQGLLKSISLADLKDTDVFIIRQFDGSLITSRRGMSEAELKQSSSFIGTHQNEFAFQLMVRGPADQSVNLKVRGDDSFSKFQSSAQMSPALHKRDGNHLKPFEALKVVLINRKTGYIGTGTTTYQQLTGAASNASVALDKIVMRPPNLKIRVERTNKNIRATPMDVAYQGGVTVQDDVVKIQSEWFDHDGQPLPDVLQEYGFTGRLAVVTGPNTLQNSAGEYYVTIKPGRHLQLLRVSEQALGGQHLYFQISANPSYSASSFAGNPNASGPLRYRPQHYVPFMVLVNNAWVYRPEMQFSSYDVALQRMEWEKTDGSIELLDLAKLQPNMTFEHFIRFMFKVLGSPHPMLDSIGLSQDLVFAFGDKVQIKAKLGADQQYYIENIADHRKLSAEDLLSMRLFSLHDPNNILWQWAAPELVVPVEPHLISDAEWDEVILLMQNLKFGDGGDKGDITKNDQVKRLQQLLGLPLAQQDGVYGPTMLRAFEYFQVKAFSKQAIAELRSTARQKDPFSSLHEVVKKAYANWIPQAEVKSILQAEMAERNKQGRPELLLTEAHILAMLLVESGDYTQADSKLNAGSRATTTSASGLGQVTWATLQDANKNNKPPTTYTLQDIRRDPVKNIEIMLIVLELKQKGQKDVLGVINQYHGSNDDAVKQNHLDKYKIACQHMGCQLDKTPNKHLQQPAWLSEFTERFLGWLR